MASSENIVIHAAAAVAFAAGVPAYTWQSGQFTGVITDTGVGDITLNLNANDGIDATECVCTLTARGAVAAWPRVPFFSPVHTTDIAKQILIAQEAAVGGASAAADIDFDIAIFRLNIL